MPPRRYAESRTRSGLCRVGRELRLKPHILFSNLGKVGNRDSINAKAFEVEGGGGSRVDRFGEGEEKRGAPSLSFSSPSPISTNHQSESNYFSFAA